MFNNKPISQLLSENFHKRLLKEIASPIVWHFTYFDALKKILMTNQLKFSRSHANHFKLDGITGFSNKHPYYFCTTRSKSSYDGYSRTLSDDNEEGFVRIQLDGDKLNQICHAKASDYFGTRYKASEVELPYGKRSFYRAIRDGEADYQPISDWYKTSEDNKSNEREDTIWYTKEYLDDANRYIIRIDIYLPNKYILQQDIIKRMLYNIYIMTKELNIPLFFYESIEDFDKQTNDIKLFQS